MRASRLPSVITRSVLVCLLLASGAGCYDEDCYQVRSCGDQTLSACTDNVHGCRYKSSDGHAWSCPGRHPKEEYGGNLACDDAPCKTAAQEAVDWCFSQTSATRPAAWGDVLVSEIMYDPTVVADETGEWLELHNPSAALFDLFGCEIHNRDGAHTIASHWVLPAGSYRTAARFTDGGGFLPDYTYSGITLANQDRDEVSIWCGSTLVDRLGYDVFQSATSGYAISVSAGWLDSQRAHQQGSSDGPNYACPATTPYNTLDTGNEVVRDYGTPNAPNPSCS